MIKLENKAILFVFLTAIISGFSIFINKFAVTGTDPYSLTFLKNLIVAVFIFSIILASGQIKLIKNLNLKSWFSLVTIGLIGGSMPFLLFFKGLSLTTASQAAFIHKNMFLLVALLAPIFLNEKLNKNFFIAALLLVLGNSFILGNIWYFDIHSGNLHILGATVLWSIEVLISKKILENLSSQVIAWGRMFFGSIFIAFFLAFTGKIGQIWQISQQQFTWVLITAGLLLGYVLSWYKGLKHLKASTAAAVLTLGTIITTSLNLIWSKQIRLNEVLGSVLLTLGILIILKSKVKFKPLSRLPRSFNLS